VEQLLTNDLGERRLYLEINLQETHRPYDLGGMDAREAEGVVITAYLPAGPEARTDLTGLQRAIRAMDSAVGRMLATLDGAGRAEQALVVFTTDHGLAMPRASALSTIPDSRLR
jgi:N-sulfoglucosamine sulfohydrolase